MIDDKSIDVTAGIQVMFLIVSNFISAVSALVLMCFLSVPAAMLSAVLGLSTTSFLVLSTPAVGVSVAVTQRKRVGERVASSLAGFVVGRTVDIGQTKAVTKTHRTWNDLRQLSRTASVEWTTLQKKLRLAREAVADFERAIAEHEVVAKKLRRWSSSRKPIPVSRAEVERVVRRQKKLQQKMKVCAEKIPDRHAEVSRAFLKLQRDEVRRQKAWEAKLVRLKSELRETEDSVPLTFWAWVEKMWRRRQLGTYERAHHALWAEAKAWLAAPFDPTRDVRRQSQILDKLDGRTIECQDGKRIKLHVEVRRQRRR